MKSGDLKAELAKVAHVVNGNAPGGIAIDSLEEQWKPIPSWPQYEVSDRGHIRSWLCRQGVKRAHPKYKKLTAGKDGYLRVTLHERCHLPNQRNQTFLVHRLVASCFVDGVDLTKDVAHLDGNKRNNIADNLVWATRAENESHKILHGTKAYGSKHGQSKLCERAVVAIKTLYEVHRWTQTEIATLFQVTQGNISAIVLEKSWRQA